MKVGVLITSIGDFGKKGFYNVQEIGFVRSLGKKVEKVTLYKLVSDAEKNSVEYIDRNIEIRLIQASKIGNNGILNTNKLDREMDVLIYFCDMQLEVPHVFKWAQRNHILFIPYIGVIESHSSNRLKRKVVNFLFKRNIKIYKKCHCFVKTPTVKEKLYNLGVEDISIMPVGLDLTLLKNNYRQYLVADLKEKYRCRESDKILLFIGRLVKEKDPLRMIEIFKAINERHGDYKLIIVGSGNMKSSVEEEVKKNSLQDKVKLIEKVPNSEIWELYRIADSFINLNKQEIYGMSILEAMYYECKVIACYAPGPMFIIEDKKTGYLVNSNSEIVHAIENGDNTGFLAHNSVLSHFTWDGVVLSFYNRIEKFYIDKDRKEN